MTEVAKNCSRMKMVLKVTKSLFYLSCRISRPCVAFCNLAWSYKAIYGLIWPHMILHGLLFLIWSYMVFYGLTWQNIDLIGLVSSFLAVIDPNSFGLVSLGPNFHPARSYSCLHAFLISVKYSNLIWINVDKN